MIAGAGQTLGHISLAFIKIKINSLLNVDRGVGVFGYLRMSKRRLNKSDVEVQPTGLNKC
jgi:hypothetical protein